MSEQHDQNETIEGLGPEPQKPKRTGFGPLDHDDEDEYRKDHRAWRQRRDELLRQRDSQ